MLDELQRRNYAPITMKQYLRIINEFAGYFDRPIEKLGPNDIRVYQAHLFRDRKLSSRTVRQHVAALRFMFVKTLKRAYMLEYIPFPKEERRLPINSQSGRGDATHNSVGFIDAPRDVDDAVRNWFATHRSSNAAGRRH